MQKRKTAIQPRTRKTKSDILVASLFKNGTNQAIRLPREMEFQGVRDVLVRREGDSIILTPVRKSWISFADLPEVADSDFMLERPELIDTQRVNF